MRILQMTCESWPANFRKITLCCQKLISFFAGWFDSLWRAENVCKPSRIAFLVVFVCFTYISFVISMGNLILLSCRFVQDRHILVTGFAFLKPCFVSHLFLMYGMKYFGHWRKGLFLLFKRLYRQDIWQPRRLKTSQGHRSFGPTVSFCNAIIDFYTIVI